MKACLIGGGKMAEAIVSAAIDCELVRGSEIGVCDVSPARRRLMKRRYGVQTFSDSKEMLGLTNMVFLAVKPQDLDELLSDISTYVTRKHLVISIAAGKKIEGIESLLPAARVVRVMPNLAVLVSQGMSVFCLGKRANERDRRKVVKWLSCFGETMELPEKSFDAVTALSGSCPAFFAYFLALVIDAGTQLGLSKKNAQKLAEQTMIGTVELMSSRGMTADELIKAVSSKKGTTEAGMAVLKKAPMQDAVRKTLKAAAERSKQLSR